MGRYVGDYVGEHYRGYQGGGYEFRVAIQGIYALKEVGSGHSCGSGIRVAG